MDSYNKFLAENVLTEDKVVTYRLLSRTLRVYVNTAKQMLFEFHKSQNARRPGAVHATYLVYGTKKDVDGSQKSSDGDVEMTSSAPEVEALTDVVPTLSLSLIPEERLKDALAEYEEVSSIHVYSIGPHPLKDLALLADAANEALTLGSGNDGENVATITNPGVRRRERQGAGLKTAAAATAKAKPAMAKPQVKPQPKSVFSKPAQVAAPAKVKEEPTAAQPTKETAEKATSSAQAKKPAPALKRNASSGIMQAFSKAAAKPKKETKATSSGGDDSSMQVMSDDGEDDEEMPQPKPRASSSRSKKQREEDLRRMMEEDDEEEEEEASEKEETPVEEPMEEEPPAPEPVKEEETEVVTATTNGRRRGKRRVMRKKQIMDDQGYLVTIQEPGWESFSEDEAPPPAKVVKTASSAPPAQATKAKKGAQKGQGSIMSFFSKK